MCLRLPRSNAGWHWRHGHFRGPHTGIVTQASPVVMTAKLKPRTCAVKPMPTGGGSTIWHQEPILGRRSWVII
jgi:hypothetical protein